MCYGSFSPFFVDTLSFFPKIRLKTVKIHELCGRNESEKHNMEHGAQSMVWNRREVRLVCRRPYSSLFFTLVFIYSYKIMFCFSNEMKSNFWNSHIHHFNPFKSPGFLLQQCFNRLVIHHQCLLSFLSFHNLRKTESRLTDRILTHITGIYGFLTWFHFSLIFAYKAQTMKGSTIFYMHH